MPLDQDVIFLERAINAGLLDAEKGRAALVVYAQVQKMGAQFSFGQFLVEQHLISSMALTALESNVQQTLNLVSTVGDYELLELIGEGRNGSVFKALQKSLDRMVALKILHAELAADPDMLQRFKNEAQATARLSHPNVVQGIDVGASQGLNYFAMELVEGGSARKALQAAGGVLDEPTALNIVCQAAEGLKAAHAIKLLHRDIKPDNILLTSEGQAKLADLGISQMANSPDNETDSVYFWASPEYAAPEVILGTGNDDPRSDLYSLGATFFELLAGHPPYVKNSPKEIMHMHVNAPIPDVQVFRADVTAQTAELIKSMLIKQPAQRIQDAATVASTARHISALLSKCAAHVRPIPATGASGKLKITPRRGVSPKIRTTARKYGALNKTGKKRR